MPGGRRFGSADLLLLLLLLALLEERPAHGYALIRMLEDRSGGLYAPSPGMVSGASPGSGGFMPFGATGVLTAVTTSGIVFAYNGFQSPLNLAGEARNPDRSIPLAVVGSVAIAAVQIITAIQGRALTSSDGTRISSQQSSLASNTSFAQVRSSLGYFSGEVGVLNNTFQFLLEHFPINMHRILLPRSSACTRLG